MNSNTSVYCKLPWVHLAVKPSGEVRLCCRAEHPISSELNLNKMSLSEIFHSEKMNEVREQMKKGPVLPDCGKCDFIEKAKGRSMRERQKKKYSHIHLDKPELKYIELAFNNKCNLSCAYCEPLYSSSWTTEHQMVFSQTIHQQETVSHEGYPIEALDIDYNELDKVKVLGGEPLLSEDYIQWLNSIDPSKIEHWLVTNGTVPISSDIIQHWREFKELRLQISIDGLDKINTYIRYPAKWNVIKNNLKILYEIYQEQNVTELKINTVFNIYNVFNYPKFEDWVMDNFPGIKMQVLLCIRPTYLSIRNLPKDVKERLKNFLPDEPRNFMMLEPNDDFQNFIEFTKKMDKLRGITITDYIPDVQQVIEKYSVGQS